MEAHETPDRMKVALLGAVAVVASANRRAHDFQQAGGGTSVANRHHVDAPWLRGLAIDAHENGKRLAPTRLDGFCSGGAYEDIWIGFADFYDGSESVGLP